MKSIVHYLYFRNLNSNIVQSLTGNTKCNMCFRHFRGPEGHTMSYSVLRTFLSNNQMFFLFFCILGKEALKLKMNGVCQPFYHFQNASFTDLAATVFVPFT